VVLGQEVGAPAVDLGEVGPVLLGRQGGAPGADPAGAVGRRPVGVVGHRGPGRVARVADPGPGHADPGAGGGDAAGVAAVALERPGAVVPALDPDDRAPDRVLLQLDLAGCLGLGVGVAVDEERVGVLVVDPEQPFLVAAAVAQGEVGGEVVVVAEVLPAADAVTVGGDHVVGEPLGQGDVVEEPARLAGPALGERRRPPAPTAGADPFALAGQRRTADGHPADQGPGRGQPLDEDAPADLARRRQLLLLQHRIPPGRRATFRPRTVRRRSDRDLSRR
jgi:hypothetical protein